MQNFIEKLMDSGFLVNKLVAEENLLHIKNPCQFVVSAEVIADVKDKYLPGEEIGGILWLLPKTTDGNRICSLERVTYIRNAIEDHPQTDGSNKSNAYLPDTKDLNSEICSVFESGYLPVKFHTHPTQNSNFLLSMHEQMQQAQTSEADRKESKRPFVHGSKKLLIPRALIIGNELKSGDIFFHIYGGEIAPLDLEKDIKKVQDENLKLFSEMFSELQISDTVKVLIAIVIIVLIIVAIRNPKAGISMLLIAAMATPLFLSKTDHLKSANYYNKLSSGEAKISIP